MPHFLLKLIPPRPSFPADITEEEQKLMAAHVSFWGGLVESDVALVFGPVFDPNGVYGLAIMKATDEEEARAISARDPVIAADRGFRYDIHLMQAATRADVTAARSVEETHG
jgi:uncharacterized protein YciI